MHPLRCASLLGVRAARWLHQCSQTLAHAFRVITTGIELQIEVVLGARTTHLAQRGTNIANQLLGGLRRRIGRQIEDTIEDGDRLLVLLRRQGGSRLGQGGLRVADINAGCDNGSRWFRHGSFRIAQNNTEGSIVTPQSDLDHIDRAGKVNVQSPLCTGCARRRESHLESRDASIRRHASRLLQHVAAVVITRRHGEVHLHRVTGWQNQIALVVDLRQQVDVDGRGGRITAGLHIVQHLGKRVAAACQHQRNEAESNGATEIWGKCCAVHGSVEASVGRSVFIASRFLDLREGGVGIDVAGAGAVLQFGNRVKDARRVDFLVLVGLELIGVTTRAVRAIGGELPTDDFAVVAVTVVAVHTGAMRAIAD